MKGHKVAAGMLAVLALAGCGSHYRLADVERTRIVVDSRYDAMTDSETASFIAPYRHTVDSIMSPVVGRVARYMSAERPESTLSNLLADILVWGATAYGEKPDFAVYNMGGMRAAFSEGDVTYGDVLDVAPFENKICFLTLKGDKVLELFGQIAMVGGEAVSHGVELVMTKDNKLVSARLNGHDIDTERNYRVVTLDYLSQGNDKMEAFKSGTDLNSPASDDNNVRFIIMKYMTEVMSQGGVVDSKIEGRIKIK